METIAVEASAESTCKIATENIECAALESIMSWSSWKEADDDY